MSTIFTKIINGEIPCHKLAEDDRYFSFLDIRPMKTGHALVIPKQDTDYLFDLDDDLLGGLLVFAKPIAKALEAEIECEKVGVIVAGLEVRHAHVHLVPFSAIGELNFAHAAPAEQDELATLAEGVRARLG